MSRWDHRQYASASDPARQSDLNDIASPHGCSRRFFFRKNEEATGIRVERTTIHWSTARGTAVHALIQRALAPAAWAKFTAHGARAARSEAFFRRLIEVYDEELDAARNGLTLDWKEEDPEHQRHRACVMVRELVVDLLERVERPLAIEAPFLVELDGYYLKGTIDLAYEPKGRPGEIGFADWKSGKTRAHPVELAHGYQVAIYAHAVEHGVLWPGTERETKLGKFPCEIHVVHMRELLPYAKRTAFTLERPEEIGWAIEQAEALGISTERIVRGALVEVEPSSAPPPKLKKDGTPYKERARKRVPALKLKSDRSGPAWYAAPRTPDDVARLRVSLSSIVGTVRLGRFYESLGEQCDRCPFKGPCLTDGHQVGRDDLRAVNRALAAIDGVDDLLDYAV